MNEIPTDSEEMAEEHEEQPEIVVVNDCESVSDKVREQHREQKSANFFDTMTITARAGIWTMDRMNPIRCLWHMG